MSEQTRGMRQEAISILRGIILLTAENAIAPPSRRQVKQPFDSIFSGTALYSGIAPPVSFTTVEYFNQGSFESKMEVIFDLMYTSDLDGFLTTQDVAARLGVTPRRVLALIAAGRLPATKVGEGRRATYFIAPPDLAKVKNRPTGKEIDQLRERNAKLCPGPDVGLEIIHEMREGRNFQGDA